MHGEGIASPQTDRVVLHADDGREIECELGPSLERYGVPLRQFTFSFEPPLVGEFIAYDEGGNVLDRDRYNNWPPE